MNIQKESTAIHYVYDVACSGTDVTSWTLEPDVSLADHISPRQLS